jgi:hypothetical protein
MPSDFKPFARRLQPSIQLTGNVFCPKAQPPLRGTLPYNTDPPPCLQQVGHSTFIDMLVSMYFPFPKISSRGRPFEQIAIVAMPETTMDEHDRLVSRQYNIRSAW